MKNLIEGQPFTDETRAKNERPTLDVDELIRSLFGQINWNSDFSTAKGYGRFTKDGYMYNLKPYLRRFLIPSLPHRVYEWQYMEVFFPDIQDLLKWHKETFGSEPLEIIEPSKVVPDGCLIIATFRDGSERLYQIDEPLSSSKSDTDWLLSRIEESEVDQKPIGFRTAVIEKLN